MGFDVQSKLQIHGAQVFVRQTHFLGITEYSLTMKYDRLSIYKAQGTGEVLLILYTQNLLLFYYYKMWLSIVKSMS